MQAELSGVAAVPGLRSRSRWGFPSGACTGAFPALTPNPFTAHTFCLPYHHHPATPWHTRPFCNKPYACTVQAPLVFDRENLTTTQPVQGSGTITLDYCSFACPTTIISLSAYQVVSRVWTPLELLSSLNFGDSRMILLQQSLTTANDSWGPTPLLMRFMLATTTHTAQCPYLAALHDAQGFHQAISLSVHCKVFRSGVS